MANEINFEMHQRDIKAFEEALKRMSGGTSDTQSQDEIDDVITDDIETYPELTTAKEIYDAISSRIYKQDKAKRAASIVVHNTLCGRRQNVMFVGPSGCGKTFIWKELSKLYPGLIHFVDASLITTEGFKGEVKWSTILSKPELCDGKPKILVLDEIDKLITPQHSGAGDNVSFEIMSQALKFMEGIVTECGPRGDRRMVDTNKISFVFCGAFSLKAEDIAEKESGTSIGFLADTSSKKPMYHREITVKDIIAYGATPEFMGRIEQVVNLEPITEQDFVEILNNPNMGPISELSELYGITVNVDTESASELARIAATNPLGMRAVRNFLRMKIDDLLFDNNDLTVAEI